jgi:argininosuccinate synthase
MNSKPQVQVLVADESHVKYVDEILDTITDAAKVRGTGIAKRSPEYVKQKMLEHKAVVAISEDGEFAGFSYIECWSNRQFVANSGLIVAPKFRGMGLAKRIKERIFDLSREKFPEAKIFSLTTGAAVMKMNFELGYRPVTFDELTTDPAFWRGCESCVNYDILQRNGGHKCLCVGLLYDPAESLPRCRVASACQSAQSESTQNPINQPQNIEKTKMNQPKKKVVLAFSGGLDTSFAVKYLSEECGYEVYTAIANTGGFDAQELEAIKERALALGAREHATLDVTDEYYQKSIKYMIFGNVLRNGTYPISVSSERIFQAIAIINYAKQIGAHCVAHGSTSAGNDQVRFDLTFQILAPEIEIITPTRDMNLTREYEIEYLKRHGYVADFKKMEYSINKGLWGTSIGGKETLHSEQTLPEEAYPTQMTATEPSQMTIDFEEGQIVAVNGERFANPVDAIRRVESVAGPYAVGRDMHIGDTIIGIKGRVGFEAAAPMVIIAAHKMLEKHTLTKWQQYWKDQLGNWYGMFLHEAQYLEPVMRDIEAYLDKSQRNVTGRVIVALKPYHFDMVGVESDFDLMKTSFGEYGELSRAWNGEDIKGFTKIMGNQMKIYHAKQQANNRNDQE